MANYKDIKGFHVQTLSTDPVAAQGSWSSGGNLNTASHTQAGGAGIATAALVTGGEGPPSVSPRNIAATETYNGSAWTEVADLNQARPLLGAAGTSTAAIATGGNNPGNDVENESWNGSAWTEVGDLNVGNKQFAQNGTSTAAFVAGGNNAITTYSVQHEQWNGSAWTETTEINTGRNWLSGFGITTADVIAGGRTPGSTAGTALVESWNGSAWTETAEVNTAFFEAASGSGTSTAGMLFGGYDKSSNLAKTETWNGSAWTELADLATARRDAASANSQPGTTESALNFGGYATAYSSATEEWSAPPDFSQMNEGQVYFNSSSTNAFKLTSYGVPGGAWASGGAMNNARRGAYRAGTQTAGLVTGGSTAPPPGPITATETYNGSSWTETGHAMNTGRRYSAGFGLQTAAIAAGGIDATTPVNNTETYNGSSWSEQNNLNTARHTLAGSIGGSTTAGLVFGGGPPFVTVTESWDGTSWTEVNDMNGARGQMGSGGTQTAAITAGGTPMPGSGALSESYDGSSWTETSDLNTGRQGPGGFGHVHIGTWYGSAGPDSNIDNHFVHAFTPGFTGLSTGYEGIKKGKVGKESKKKNAEINYGYEMLLSQAVRSFEIWLGQKAPYEAMKKAILGGFS